MAQAMHAAIAFGQQHPHITEPWYNESNYLIVLNTPNEESLLELMLEAYDRDITFSDFYEPDLKDSLTAIAFQPGAASKQLCAHLPLALSKQASARPCEEGDSPLKATPSGSIPDWASQVPEDLTSGVDSHESSKVVPTTTSLEREKVAVMTAAVIDSPIRLLNASYEPLSENYSVHKAARLLALGKAIVEEGVPGRFLGEWVYPKVLKLTYYVQIAYKKIYGAPRVSKRGVLERDQRICAFDKCQNIATTIDHVQPRSRGGKNTWQNLVAACSKCNHRKGNRTPQEAGMVLKWTPKVPAKAQLFTPRG